MRIGFGLVAFLNFCVPAGGLAGVDCASTLERVALVAGFSPEDAGRVREHFEALVEGVGEDGLNRIDVVLRNPVVIDETLVDRGHLVGSSVVPWNFLSSHGVVESFLSRSRRHWVVPRPVQRSPAFLLVLLHEPVHVVQGELRGYPRSLEELRRDEREAFQREYQGLQRWDLSALIDRWKREFDDDAFAALEREMVEVRLLERLDGGGVRCRFDSEPLKHRLARDPTVAMRWDRYLQLRARRSALRSAESAHRLDEAGYVRQALASYAL